MNWREKLAQLRNEQKSLLETVKAEKRAFTADEQADFDAKSAEIVACTKMLDAENVIAANEAARTTVVNTGASDVRVKRDEPIFKNLTEQLAAIKDSAVSGVTDERLVKMRNASGMNTGVGSEGGFAVQSDFAGLMLESAVSDSPILSMVDQYQVANGADRVEWVDIDESDISTTVFGGVQVYRAPEASAVAASKPKLKEKELKLEKLMGVAYSTFELDSASGFVDQLYTRAFTTAIRRTLEGEIISGDGIGRALGILNGSGLVTVAKEAGQANDTIVWDNLSKMYHRAIQNGGNYAWLVNPDAHQQLDSLSVPVGTAGVPVYSPANSNSAVNTLRGLPVISTDHCSALGDKGDIILADMSDYLLAYRGGIQKDVSIHVSFLTAENAFRFIYLANGRPKTTNTLTIKNSSGARGRYITLAAR